MKTIAFFPILFFSIMGFAQGKKSIVKFINPASVSTPKGYSHAAVIDLGNCYMVTISGQVALDSAGNLVGAQSVGKQAEQVFTNIKNIIAEAGGTMDNLVKIGYYVLDVSQIQTLRDVRNKFINLNNPPASTLVQVSKLFRDDILVEIDATAIIPKK